MNRARLPAIRERARTYPGVADSSVYREYIDSIESWDGRGDPPSVPDDTNLWRWYDQAAKDRAYLLEYLDSIYAMVRT